jgi:hypothetical protein
MVDIKKEKKNRKHYLSLYDLVITEVIIALHTAANVEMQVDTYIGINKPSLQRILLKTN